VGGSGPRAARSALGPGRNLKATHALEAALARALAAGVRTLPWRASLGVGAALGGAMGALGIRRDVAAANLARAFPERSAAERAAILRAHYRELGRVAVEYARLGELVRSPAGEVIARVSGLEHLELVRAAGRGAILLSGHVGSFELVGALLGQQHPVDFVVRPLSNPAVESLLSRARAGAGVGEISAATGTRRVFEALRANRWVAMLADQDARRLGVFVPFFGHPASTAIGPARFALATGAPIVMGFDLREPDGRHVLEIDPPLEPGDPKAPGAVERLTALHVARLEQVVRARPESWFWLHRRWKTAPPEPARAGAG
jgi:KDO2-lipid IV(A) lauroyltransferase